MRRAIYPGTFDPVTNGHIHIAERACKLFDEVIVAVAADNYKNTLFSVSERLQMMEESLRHLKNVKVESFSGLVADFARARQGQALIRGLRAVTDFEYEMQIAAMNKRLNENLETLFLMTSGEYSFLSSSVIKQVAILGGSVKGLVPQVVEKNLQKKYNQNG
ncbi:MAG: pantetheine-phosphate adenylyltransferase [Peptococcaceae bacterium]|nr:pantetheine-phosphate adenylyltransferase [Peptococcaceae bacterium]MDH7525639.1 pantetheine-phosphate adenylyltransferase [Peptococcaceae bacterium]